GFQEFQYGQASQRPGKQHENPDGIELAIRGEHPNSEPGTARQSVHRVSVGTASSSLEIDSIFFQSTDFGKTAVRPAVAASEFASTLHRRSSRCNQDQS